MSHVFRHQDDPPSPYYNWVEPDTGLVDNDVGARDAGGSSDEGTDDAASNSSVAKPEQRPGVDFNADFPLSDDEVLPGMREDSDSEDEDDGSRDGEGLLDQDSGQAKVPWPVAGARGRGGARRGAGGPGLIGIQVWWVGRGVV